MEKSDIISHEAPGTVISDRKTLLVKTGNGVVSLLSIQPENKKSHDGQRLLNGQKVAYKRRCI